MRSVIPNRFSYLIVWDRIDGDTNYEYIDFRKNLLQQQWRDVDNFSTVIQTRNVEHQFWNSNWYPINYHKQVFNPIQLFYAKRKPKQKHKIRLLNRKHSKSKSAKQTSPQQKCIRHINIITRWVANELKCPSYNVNDRWI